jgi:hypothetical protein
MEAKTRGVWVAAGEGGGELELGLAFFAFDLLVAI